MIEIKDLSLHLGDFHLADINLSVADGEYFVVLGPTGAGKTVLIECVAGLHRIRHGEIWMDHRDVTHRASEERNVGYVPQDYVLFPFLSVVDNIAFGLRQAGRGRRKSGVRSTKWPDCWASPTCCTVTRVPSAAVRNSGWPWPGRWRLLPVFCSSMSRWVPWTSAPGGI
ncbi:MAG: ATP-binding cassette domain-containing protein [Chloroflexota bacterium]